MQTTTETRVGLSGAELPASRPKALMDEAASVLIVEDEPTIADSVRYGLEREGYAVEVVADGSEALAAFRLGQHSMVVLDLMLPGMAGLDVCRAIRAESDVPIIIVTAKDSEADKVAGLELGADDYVTKPFSIRELISRVRANLRRASTSTSDQAATVLHGGPVEIDIERHELRVRGETVAVPPKEFDLLALLVERKGRLLTRDFLLERIWGADYFGDTKTLDVHVKRLRSKIELDPHEPVHLVTVRGLGYKFND